ncbi:MAG: CDP-alcohol phosphatidyltransferase family protein [Acidimicrobiales bacterium]
MLDHGGPDVAGEPHSLPAEGDGGLDRVWTVPNLLSIARLGLIGLFVWLLFGANARIAAAIVLAVAGATDFVDGYVARRFHQVSTLGKVLDPTADRIVLGTGVIAIAVYGAVPAWLAGVVLSREVLVSGAVLLLAALGARRIDVLWAGKAATFGLMVCFPVLLLADGSASWANILRVATWVALIPVLGLSLFATLSYVPLARRALADRRLSHPDPARPGGIVAR